MTCYIVNVVLIYDTRFCSNHSKLSKHSKMIVALIFAAIFIIGSGSGWWGISMLCTKSKTYFHSCLASSPDFQLLPLETELSAFSNFHLKIFDSLSYEQKKKIESALTTNKICSFRSSCGSRSHSWICQFSTLTIDSRPLCFRSSSLHLYCQEINR